MAFELVKYNWARDIADMHLGTRLKECEKFQARFGNKMLAFQKEDYDKGLKLRHPDIDVNAIACLMAADYGEWRDKETTRSKIINYGISMKEADKYIKYSLDIMDGKYNRYSILNGVV